MIIHCQRENIWDFLVGWSKQQDELHIPANPPLSEASLILGEHIDNIHNPHNIKGSSTTTSPDRVWAVHCSAVSSTDWHKWHCSLYRECLYLFSVMSELAWEKFKQTGPLRVRTNPISRTENKLLKQIKTTFFIKLLNIGSRNKMFSKMGKMDLVI